MVEEREGTYERANGNAGGHGRDGGGADVAGDAAAGSECGEDECDVVEGGLAVVRLLQCEDRGGVRRWKEGGYWEVPWLRLCLL